MNGDEKELVSWATLGLTVIPRLALVVSAGARVIFKPVKVSAGDMGFITFGPTLPEAIPHGLEMIVGCQFEDGRIQAGREDNEIQLFIEPIPRVDPQRPWIEVQFPLDRAVDRIVSFYVEYTAASKPGNHQSKLGIYEFVISDKESLELNRARAFKQLRMRNEQANFDVYYQHAIFKENAPSQAGPPPDFPPHSTGRTNAQPDLIGPKKTFGKALKKMYRAVLGQWTTNQPRKSEEWAPDKIPIVSSTNAFTYSHHLLLQKLQLKPPTFRIRLEQKLREFPATGALARSGKFHVLSLCSGAARIENDLIRGLSTENMKMTLVDINPNLLDTAKQRLSQWCEVEGVLGDVNELDLQDETYDLIMCVSGLHHVVELEHLIRTVADGLNDSGEFWSIGETVGRNGGRLWPESYTLANDFFRRLDEKYRINRNTGSNVDEFLPDMDYSIGCFEGIRSEAIEPNLARYLNPADVCRYNCFLWKLFSLSYADNYDINLPEDRTIIEKAVDLEIHHYRNGGRPVGLDGIYKRI